MGLFGFLKNAVDFIVAVGKPIVKALMPTFISKIGNWIGEKVSALISNLQRNAKSYENIIPSAETAYEDSKELHTAVVYKENLITGDIFEVIAEKKLSQEEKRDLPEHVRRHMKGKKVVTTPDRVMETLQH